MRRRPIRNLPRDDGARAIRLKLPATDKEAVAWLKQNFVQALRVDDLADRAHMSPSTFRQHFRALTGLSP